MPSHCKRNTPCPLAFIHRNVPDLSRLLLAYIDTPRISDACLEKTERWNIINSHRPSVEDSSIFEIEWGGIRVKQKHQASAEIFH